jgi:hypothetical protein
MKRRKEMKPPYYVATVNLGAVLDGTNPSHGKLTDFKDIEQARQFAKAEKDKWHIVTIFRRDSKGELEKIARYQKGELYIGEKRVR